LQAHFISRWRHIYHIQSNDASNIVSNVITFTGLHLTIVP